MRTEIVTVLLVAALAAAQQIYVPILVDVAHGEATKGLDFWVNSTVNPYAISDFVKHPDKVKVVLVHHLPFYLLNSYVVESYRGPQDVDRPNKTQPAGGPTTSSTLATYRTDPPSRSSLTSP
jgi:hypothetical protein